MSENKTNWCRIVKELLYVGVLPLLFYITAYHYLKNGYKQLPLVMVIVYLCTALWLLLFLGIVIRNIKSGQLFDWNVLISKYYYKVLLFCILIVFNIQSIYTIQRWDGMLYYTALLKACNAFDFSLQGLVDGFRIVHPSHGYYCFLAIGAYLFENQLVGILLMQMILYMITMFCYLGLLRLLFPSAKEKYCFLGTLFFAFSPLVFGIEPIISCDFGVLCYLVIFLYVSLKHYPLLELWVAVLLILSKQQGVLYYVAFYGIVFLVNMSRFYKENHRLNGKEIRRLLCRMIPGFIGIGYYLLSSASPFAWIKGMRNTVVAGKDMQTLQGIGVNGGYIIEKLKQIFILNFAWVNWLIIFIGFGYLIYIWKKQERNVRLDAPFWGLLGVGFVFLMFNFFVVTYAHPRYLSVGTVLSSIGAFGTLIAFLDRCMERVIQIFLYMLTGFSLVASFVSVDPVSFLLFKSFPVGALSMYRPLYDNPSMYPSDIYADNTIYNRQFAFYTLLEEKMLREIQYDGSIPLLEVDMSKGQHEQGTYDYINMMLEGMYGRTTFYWNVEIGKLTENANDIPMRVFYFSSEQIDAGEANWRGETLPETAYAILLPRQDRGILNTLQKEYEIKEKYDVSAYGMSVAVYKVEKIK